MTLSRLDLDGTGSPAGLVTRILKLQPSLPIPVPLEELCAALDISAIQTLTTEGFEAALITDSVKSQGIILVAEGRSRQRRRFSIAHELGHFLIPTHRADQGGFQCSSRDLAIAKSASADTRTRIEIEANRFASLLLVPPPKLRAELDQIRTPDIYDVVRLAKLFDVSKEVLVRAYVEHSSEAIAFVIVRDGRVERTYRHERDTPWIAVRSGDRVPTASLCARLTHSPGSCSAAEDCDPTLWLEAHHAARVEQMTEQVLGQQNGFALVMLHMVLRDDDDVHERGDKAGWAPSW